MRKLFTLITFVVSTSLSFGQISAWDFDASNNSASSTVAGTVCSDAVFNGVGAGSFVTGFDPDGAAPDYLDASGFAYQSDDWAIGAFNTSKYLEFTVNGTTENLNFEFLELALKRDADGPQYVGITTSLDAHAATIATINLSTTTEFTVPPAINLLGIDPGFSDLPSLTIRIYGYGATTSTGVLAFDEIAFKTTVLPVELAYFKGNADGNASLLEWATYSELNNAYYDVQHSTDGKEFTTIEEIEGAGNSTNYNTYRPSTGINYYRLRQVDFDGQFTYSEMIVVEHQAIAAVDIKVFPNPVVDWVTVQLPSLETDAVISVYNSTGQLMQETVISSFENTAKLTTNDWANGQYLIRIQAANQVITKQIIKF